MRMSEVQHQPRAQRIIQQALASARMPHAYLFAGPEGVGKEMLAVGLAQTLLCASPVQTQTSPGSSGHSPASFAAGDITAAADACGDCQDCQLVQAGTHPDLYLIFRQLNRQHPDSTIRKRLALTFNVEVIRHFVIDRAGHRPSRGRAKVFIIREAERMNDAAQNSLLKTLEEPPPDTFIILLTSAVDAMLQTTRSRCQLVRFGLLPVDFVAEQIRALCPEAAPEAVAFAARHAGGSLGQALREIDDDIYTVKRAWGQRLVEVLRTGSGGSPHALAGPLEADARALGKFITDRDPDVSDTDAARAGIQTLLSLLGSFYLDALRRSTGADLPPFNPDQAETVNWLAGEHGSERLAVAIRELARAESTIGRNANIALALETLFIQLARLPATSERTVAATR
ncbi:MAG: hypothetical protein AMXMBFR13_25730 [Phycisphaerae bacterium]